MSLKAARHPLVIRSQQSLNEALFEEGYKYVAGKLEDLFILDPRKLDPAEIAEIPAMSQEAFEDLLKRKSRGARYIAQRFRYFGYQPPTIKQACSDWAALKDIQRWMEAQDKNWLASMSLAKIVHHQVDEHDYRKGHYSEWQVEAGKLLHIGIRFAWQAERFCRLYSEVCNKSRPWGSCYQPPHGKVKAIALTPNYNRLPLWVKKQMINSSVWIQEETGRIGNVWRLIDCAKAWKWCPYLPKGIAERVGKLSPKMRILADIAWRLTSPVLQYMDASANRKKELFWQRMSELSKMSLGEILSLNKDWNSYKAQRMVEIWANLPHGFLTTVLNVSQRGEIRTEAVLRWVASYSSPSDACWHLFGCRGKATVTAFLNCQNQDAIRWAIALGIKNPDFLQKLFALGKCIEFQGICVEFLKQLKPEAALRMISTTSFKIRGKVKPVEDFLVKDTGYLWSQIEVKPDLGRVRCWLSVHEELARHFVAEQPDEALPIATNWQPLQGLCSVDGAWSIELPTRTATLKLWGEQLHHCVGGYGPKIKQGDCVIFGVRVDGIVRYTVEMIGARCNQFYGDRNSHPPQDLKDSVLDAISQARI